MQQSTGITLESCVTTLLKYADALSLECEKKQDSVELVTKSNLFRKTAIKKEAISELKEVITKLETELKNVQMMK